MLWALTLPKFPFDFAQGTKLWQSFTLRNNHSSKNIVSLLWLIHFEMNALELKTNIFQLVEKLEDTDVLRAINTLLEKQFGKSKQADFWDDLPQSVRNDIKLSEKESDAGMLRSHSEVMNAIKSKYALV